MFDKRTIDTDLGPLTRTRGMWRGSIRLGDAAVPVAVPGGRSGPDGDALALASTVPGAYPGWLPAVREALAEHLDVPDLVVPPPVHAAVVTIDRLATVELGYLTPYDDDHTIGVRFRGGRMVECNGSVPSP